MTAVDNSYPCNCELCRPNLFLGEREREDVWPVSDDLRRPVSLPLENDEVDGSAAERALKKAHTRKIEVAGGIPAASVMFSD